MVDRQDYRYVGVREETKENIEKLSKLTDADQYRVVDHAVASLMTEYLEEFEGKYREELKPLEDSSREGDET